MTFTEAALEVLRAAGEPLHYKRITELAIQRNLLSHVGKSPEITMSARLATLVKKDRGEVPIVKVKPGVFAVRDVGDDRSYAAASEQGENGAGDESQPERPTPPGADVFPEEEGDDDPILAGLGDSEGGGSGSGAGEPAEQGGERLGRRRRRRRRGGRGRGDGPGVPGEGGGERGDRGDPQQGRGRGDQDRQRGGRNDQGGGRGDHGARRPERERDDVDLGRAPDDGDLLGKDLADAAFAVLSQADRIPTSYARVADLLVRRGRLSGDPQQLAPTVAAALRADVALAARDHARSRFRLRAGQVSLATWRLSREAARWEEETERAAERQRAEVRRAFVARLNELPAAGFAELVATWLNAEGVTSLRAVRRPGSSGSVFHFAGTLRGAEERRLAIVVQRAGRDIDRETVIEVRGSLHHYGNAVGAWIASTGRVMSGAREEVAAEGGAPVAVFDGSALATAMERLGIGLRRQQVSLADIDFDLLESLGDSGERRDRDQGRHRPERDDPRRDAVRDEGAMAAPDDEEEPVSDQGLDASGDDEAGDLAALGGDVDADDDLAGGDDADDEDARDDDADDEDEGGDIESDRPTTIPGEEDV